MAQNQELYDFSGFYSLEEKEQFIKYIIRKQVELAHILLLLTPPIELYLFTCI